MAQQLPALNADSQSPSRNSRALREHRLPYQPGLDGLRALAVLAVLFYHADVRWMRGGFLGVEMFFVLSGYLITSLLLAEWNVRGTVSLKEFWKRRARRLLPALLLMLGGTLAFAVLFLPDEIAGLRADAAAALGYVFNWHLVLSDKSYFEIIGRPSLLQHLWSLGVEEQFYLLWPLLFILAMRLWPRRRVFFAVIAGAAASTLLMALLFQPEGDPSRVYYGTDTRAAGFLAGAALAFVWPPGRVQDRARHLSTPTLDAVGIVSLLALAGFCIWIDEYQSSLYRGGFAAVGLMTMVLIAITVHPRASLVPRLLGGRPLRWLGQRSYAIYLWHWPVYMVTRPQLDVPYEGPLLLGMQLAVILLLADVSYHFVESPIRGGSLGRAWLALSAAHGARLGRLRVQWAGTLGFLLVFCIVLGIPIVNAEPPEEPAFLSIESIDTISSGGTGGPFKGATAELTPFIGITSEAPAVGAAASPIAEQPASPDPLQTTQNPSNAATMVPGTAQESSTLVVTSAIVGAPAPEATSLSPSSSAKSPATAVSQPPAVPTDAGTSHQAAQAPSDRSIQEAIASVASTPVVPDLTPQAPPDQSVQEAVNAMDLTPLDPTLAVQKPTPAPGLNPTTAPQGDLAASRASQSGGPEPTVPPAMASGSLPPSPERVTAIGDSVMLSAAEDLANTVANVEIDAKVGRQVADAIKILRTHRNAGQIGPIVIVHLGNNGAFRAKQFDEIMQVLSGARKVVFINVKVPRNWQKYNNRMLADAVERYPKAVLLDWHAATASQPDLFWKDGYHMRPEGARLYTELIVTEIQNPWSN